MRWFVALALIAGASCFLYFNYRQQIAEPPKPPPPVPAAVAKDEPAPLLSVEDLARVKKSAADPDTNVRWSALQLLFAFHDPDAVALLEKAIAEDPDQELRLKAIRLLSSAKDVDKVPGLVRGLKDTDREVRLASLKALGDVADPAATPWVVEALKDPDSDIKVAALDTLGKFQDKRKKDFKALADKLRKQYEDAIAQENGKKKEARSDPWKVE